MGCKEKGSSTKTTTENGFAIAEPDELVTMWVICYRVMYNNKLKSTIHQVVNPPRELWGTSRYSIPFYASGE
jgi:isopenicillin N synthase-like dioxygenase